MSARNTTTTTARLTALETSVGEIKALLTVLVDANAPAKASTKASRKASRKGLTQPGEVIPEVGLPTTVARCGKRTADGSKCRNRVGCKVAHKAPARKGSVRVKVPSTKGVQGAKAGGGTLSTKAWNRTLTTKARFMGGGAYKAVLASWSAAQVARAAGQSPDAFLANLLG